MADKYDVYCFDTSAVRQTNIEELFDNLARKIIDSQSFQDVNQTNTTSVDLTSANHSQKKGCCK